jgi:hypothetical protein
MIWEFIGAIVVAIGAGGVAHLIGRLVGERMPAWSVPAGAGLGMIGFVIYMEYTWAGRIIEQLPPEVTVASRNESTAWFRPWTYVWPFTNRMIVVDHRQDRRNPEHPHLLMTSVVLFGRWEPVRPVPVVFDCAEGRRADLRAGVEIAEDGRLEGATWLRLPPDDPLLRAACARMG